MTKTQKKKQKVKHMGRFRLMPLTMTMLALLLVVKLNDVFIGSRELHRALTVSSAYAEEEKEKSEEVAKEEASEEAEKPADGHSDAKGKKDGDTEEKTLGEGGMTLKEVEKLKNDDSQHRFSDVELTILQNLSERREQLDQREKDLVIKETVLAATEDRINNKIRDMKKLQVEVDKVLKLYQEKQEGEIKGLVKIYEAMKPGDAALIFNELEMPILLEVVDKMSERKVAPILAGMAPKRARDVTQELAEMRKLREEKRQAIMGEAVDR